jgi:hypothetical protein
MNSQHADQNEAAKESNDTQAAAESRPAGVKEPDAQAMTQAARAVMHPDRHDLEWRFYHGAVHS